MSGTQFVLVHGAFHGGWCWSRVVGHLRAAGHHVATPTLTGLGDRAHLVSPAVGLDTHVRDVVAALDADELDDVVLVGHSYAGQVIAGVATERPHVVRQVVYLDAFVPDDGERAVDLQPPDIAEHYRTSVAERGLGWLVPVRSPDVLGVTDPDDVAWLTRRLTPHPYKTYLDPARVSGESLGIPGVFIECVDWMRAFRGFREVAARRQWPVHDLESGHEAMVTAPGPLAALLGDVAGA